VVVNKVSIPPQIKDVLTIWENAPDGLIYTAADRAIENCGYEKFFALLARWTAELEHALFEGFERDEPPAGLFDQVDALNCVTGILCGIDNTLRDISYSPFATDRVMAFALALSPDRKFEGAQYALGFDAIDHIRRIPRNP
jgi:hypothetical protein